MRLLSGNENILINCEHPFTLPKQFCRLAVCLSLVWSIFCGTPIQAVATVERANKTNQTAADRPAFILNNAQAALADELYTLAEKHVLQYLELPDLSASARLEAAILLARAKHGQKDYTAMRELLLPWITRSKDTPLADSLTFWLATAEFELKNWEACSRLIKNYAVAYPGSSFSPFALRLRAWSSLKSGQRQDALNAFEAFTASYSDFPEDALNRLDWGRALFEAGETKKAEEVLRELVDKYSSERTGQAGRVLLARILLDNRQPAAAQEILRPLFAAKNISDEVRTLGLMVQAGAVEAQGDPVEALSLLEQCLSRAVDPLLKNEANLQKGELLLRIGKTEEGIALVRGFVASASIDIAAAVQLKLGNTLLEQKLYEEALVEFQNYIETFSDPKGLVTAWQARGEVLSKMGRNIEAAADLGKAAELSQDNLLKAELCWRAGECLLAAAQYRSAITAYRRVIDFVTSTDLAEQALFQIGFCLQNQNLPDEALTVYWDLADAGADELLTAQAFLQIGEILQKQGMINGARLIYRMLVSHAPPAAVATALHQLGTLDYRLGSFASALAYFKQVLREHADMPAAQMSNYMSNWCLYMLGDDEAAIQGFKKFLELYPGAPLAPDALFWLAEYNFNQQTYYLAESDFLSLTRDYPDSPLADDALFWAGRAALMQKEFRRANEHFTLLIRRYPDPGRQVEARFYQGEALCELGEFLGAILIFDEIIKQQPGSYLAERAWFRKGDSQFTLGGEDPKYYAEAIASYRVILNQAEVSPASRLQAEYKIGRCLQKTGDMSLAFENYMSVVYSFFNYPESRAKTAVWFTRAAFTAAIMMEEEKAWRKAVAIYQRVVEAKVAASPDAEERIRKIRLDQWMFFY